MVFLWLKWVHILSSVVVLGTGLGIAFFLFRANATRETGVIRFALKNTVLADLIFTLPALGLIPITGHFLMQMGPVSIKDRWIHFSFSLFLLAGICWVGALFLQWRMRGLSDEAANSGTELPPLYFIYQRIWLGLGVIAFPSVLGIFFLMVFKPAFG